MWDIYKSDEGKAVIAVNRKSGDIIQLDTMEEAQALVIDILNAIRWPENLETLSVPTEEWLTMADAVVYANRFDPERFPYDSSVPYHAQSIGRRLRKAASLGLIASKLDPEDGRRILLNRNDFMLWLRTARTPYKTDSE